MEYYEKTVNYFKFFEDIKLMEVDHINNKIAIIFFGKENIIHIFDLRPYTQYFPFHRLHQENMFKEYSNENNDPSSRLTQSATAHKNIQINSNFTSAQNEYNISLINIFKDINPDRKFDPLFNTPDKKSRIEKFTYFSFELKKIQNIQFSYFPKINEYDIAIKLKKPQIKSKILAVIILDMLSIMGLKWFDFQLSLNKQPENILMSLAEDGLICFYKQKKKNPDLITQVELNKLSSNPFSNLEEEWTRIAYFSNEKPVKDYYFSEKNNNLYILSIDNNINFYELDESKKFTIFYKKMLCFNLFPGQNLNKFILSKEESLIFGFFDECFRVFKNSQPFHRLYSFSYDDLSYLNIFKNYLKSEEKRDESNVNGNNVYAKEYNYLNDLDEHIKNKYSNKPKQVKEKVLKKQKSKNYNHIKNNGYKNLKANKSFKNPKNKNFNNKNQIYESKEEVKEELDADDLEFSDLNSSEESYENSDSACDIHEIYDFIDFNEKLVIQDDNYLLNNVQKGIVSFDNKFLLFCFYSNQTKKFYLAKFNIEFFMTKISNYEFFKKCHNGLMPELCGILMSSYDKIFFSFPPALYLKNYIHQEDKETLSASKILNTKLNKNYVLNNIYCPLAVINKEILYFIELNGDHQVSNLENKDNEEEYYYETLLDKYAFDSKYRVCYEGLDFKWLYNNTLLITAEDKLMRMVKFIYEKSIIGLLVKKDFLSI